MTTKLILIFFVFNGYTTHAATVADSWILFAKSFKDSFRNCSSDVQAGTSVGTAILLCYIQTVLVLCCRLVPLLSLELLSDQQKLNLKLGMFDCLKSSSLHVFDKMMESDVIRLTDDARLVRSNNSRKISFYSDANVRNNVWQKKDKSTVSWAEHILTKLYNIFRTHTLNIDIIPKWTGRARHRRRNQMLPMMTLGMTAAGLVMLPMGFQFLAVLTGKALLLSKMALLFATVNGLKKVASSGVHYGLYHANSHRTHHLWDRGDQERPRFQK